MTRVGFVRVMAMVALGVLSFDALVAPAGTGLAAPSITVLHGFRLDYKDGYVPRAPLLQASDGNFYGTTSGGGDDGDGCAVHFCMGTVFKLTPDGQFSSLHTFGWPYDGGSKPFSGLVEGPDGYLYGTTSEGGATGDGAVYKISKTGQFQKLHDFCQPLQLCAKEGESPLTGLVLGRDGNLYGRTSWAGAGNSGTIYRISPSGDFAVVFAFTQETGGAGQGGLVLATDGNFYGSTAGTIWRVTPDGRGTVLYRFDPQKNDGSGMGELIQAKDGNLYGVTYSPAAVYRISLDGTFKQIHLLSPAAEGTGPNTLMQTSDGNLWGSTTGGTTSQSAVFTITTDGSPIQSTFLDLATTGAPPLAPLIEGKDGKLYGTASQYGTTPDGQPASATVFVIDSAGPVPPPPAAPNPAAAPPPAPGLPAALDDSVKGDILSAIDRANDVWVTALQALDGSALGDGVAGELLQVDLTDIDRLRSQGITQNNINTEFVVREVTLDAPGHARVQTHETWYSEISTAATGQVVKETPPAAYVEMYTVEYLNGGWIVTRDEVTPD